MSSKDKKSSTGRLSQTGRTGKIKESSTAQQKALTEGRKKRKKPRIVRRAFNATVDLISGSVSMVFKAIGSVLLVIAITGMLFACVFAYYVKTCLTPELDLSLDDYKLNQSSTIYYQDAGGQWRELSTLAGKQKRIWAATVCSPTPLPCGIWIWQPGGWVSPLQTGKRSLCSVIMT